MHRVANSKRNYTFNLRAHVVVACPPLPLAGFPLCHRITSGGACVPRRQG
jgi:hypothetical protein